MARSLARPVSLAELALPCRLGASGLEEIVKITLGSDEQRQLEKSAAAVRELVEVMGLS